MEAPWQEIKRQVMDGLDMSREFTDEELRANRAGSTKLQQRKTAVAESAGKL